MSSPELLEKPGHLANAGDYVCPPLFDDDITDETAVTFMVETVAYVSEREIRQSFDTYWGTITNGRQAEVTEAEEQAAYERELSFFKKVMTAGLTMAQRHDGIVTMLFDVDGTILDATETTRPAFPVVVKWLHQFLGQRLEIGLLSTRPQTKLTEELTNPSFMTGYTGLMNPEFVISSSGEERRDPALKELSRHGSSEARRQSISYIADTEAIESLTAAYAGPVEDIWFDPKLVVMDRLARQYSKSRSFVLVDDIVPVSVVDPNHANAIGVFVQAENPYANYPGGHHVGSNRLVWA